MSIQTVCAFQHRFGFSSFFLQYRDTFDKFGCPATEFCQEIPFMIGCFDQFDETGQRIGAGEPVRTRTAGLRLAQTKKAHSRRPGLRWIYSIWKCGPIIALAQELTPGLRIFYSQSDKESLKPEWIKCEIIFKRILRSKTDLFSQSAPAFFIWQRFCIFA